MSVKIAIIGAGSQSFGPGIVRDIFLSDELNESAVELALMDIAPGHLPGIVSYARSVAERLGRTQRITAGTNLDEALRGTDFVITAIEVDRYRYWAQDFHVPRRYGFMQIYGENGGPGGLFHALRNMGPMLHIAYRMEELCPDAVLLNFTNPESKLCQAVSMLTEVPIYGLCHGVAMGRDQIARFLQMEPDQLLTAACGMNHITWFQTVRDRVTGRDLYPLLREKEREAAPLADWDELALSRMCLRVFGLWPSPGANHIGEYVRWSEEFLASSALQYFYNPIDGDPWETDDIPKFIYSLGDKPTEAPLFATPGAPQEAPGDEALESDGEMAVPIIEALCCGVTRQIDAVIVPNRGLIPGIDSDITVEVPAVAHHRQVECYQMARLPEAVTAILRTQGSIQKLLVEAYAEGSRRKLLQAMLLDPTVHSYRNAVALINEMCELQKDLLPPLAW